jgi:5-(carboxyamino)imidazole ribonucleotide mutase
VPIAAGALGGLAALLATVQMPTGIPVSTVAVDGSANAAYLAASILSVSDPDIADRLTAYREELRA